MSCVTLTCNTDTTPNTTNVGSVRSRRFGYRKAPLPPIGELGSFSDMN